MCKLFGGGAVPAPIIRAPIRDVEGPKTTTVDPNHGDAVGAAKRRRAALSKRSSRSNLRVNLATTNTDTRQGVQIT